MARYVKGLDPNHLLTIGEEGFYSTSQLRLSANPGFTSDVPHVLLMHVHKPIRPAASIILLLHILALSDA